MILGLQLIALVFTLVMIYFSYLHYRRGEINGMEILIMLLVWIGAILIVLFPNLFEVFSKTIAISRPFDLAVIGGFIFVIPLVYLAYVRTRRLEKKIEEYTRKEALESIYKKNKTPGKK